jgi:hypothetical protein
MGYYVKRCGSTAGMPDSFPMMALYLLCSTVTDIDREEKLGISHKLCCTRL